MAVLPAVDGVEDHIAVGLQADGGPGRAAGLEAGLSHAVVHQQVVPAHGLGDLVPALVRRGEGDGHRLPRRQRPQEGQGGLLPRQGRCQQHLVFLQGAGDGVLRHRLHP